MKKRSTPIWTLCLICIIAAMTVFAGPGVIPATAQAPSAQEVLATVLKQHENNMEGIKNYILVGEVNGRTYQFYYERHMVNGHPVFRVAGNPALNKMAGRTSMATNSYTFIRKLKPRAHLTGTENVNGHSTYVITANDLNGLNLNMGENISPQTITLWVDKDQFVIRKMLLKGMLKNGGKQHPFTMAMTSRQFRVVEGMLVPFKTTLTMKGILTGKQKKKMSKAMKRLQERLKKLPPKQRKRVKQMMQKMGGMKGLSKGNIKITMQIKEVHVNAGPPQGK